MIRKIAVKNICIAICCFYGNSLQAQLNTEIIKTTVSQNLYFSFTDSKQWKQIQSFYAANNFNPAWLNTENIDNRNYLLNQLKLSADIGLSEKDYLNTFLETVRNGTVKWTTLADSVETEIKITAAALHYYSDIAYGNTTPAITYKALVEMPECHDVPALLAQYINNKKLASLGAYLTPALQEIPVLENRIKWFAKLLSEPSFKEATIISETSTTSNKLLVLKLYHLGFIKDTFNILQDNAVVRYIKEAQLQFGLVASGKLNHATLQQFNTTIYERLQELNYSINYYRWLSCYSQNKSVIVVNIPAAYLKVYNQQKVKLQMKVIVGKKSTPTPTLLSTVSEVVLYPYWHVPYSIATKEILPKLKRSAAIIDAGNYQVLNRAGNITNPYSVNWKALSTKYFPYTIRQSTGCDNALGLLKLNFNSPAGVYLHDTPNKNLFSLNKRFLSHGCMRMENPTALGHLVLKNNSIAIDTLTQKGCLLNQAPIFVKAIDAMPVLVWYNPAGIDAAGNLLFFEDVYGKFKWNKKD